MLAVSDSTPLIHLAKIKKIDLLKVLFKKIYIPNEVYQEVVINGKEKSQNEIFLIEEKLKEKFIEIKETSLNLEVNNIHIGERKAINLCQELKIKNLLIDDKDGYNIAEILGLNPIRTTGLFLILLDKNIINLDEYEKSLKELSESRYFIDAETYQRLITAGRNKMHSKNKN
ncbi:MAG: hypothetical protein AABX10_02185 [Nanoarchaeota archaeon]